MKENFTPSPEQKETQESPIDRKFAELFDELVDKARKYNTLSVWADDHMNRIGTDSGEIYVKDTDGTIYSFKYSSGGWKWWRGIASIRIGRYIKNMNYIGGMESLWETSLKRSSAGKYVVNISNGKKIIEDATEEDIEKFIDLLNERMEKIDLSIQRIDKSLNEKPEDKEHPLDREFMSVFQGLQSIAREYNQVSRGIHQYGNGLGEK